MALPPEQEASYSAIIDSILASADLATISAKRIRKGLQEKVQYDISNQKDAITALIMARFDKFQSNTPGTNGVEPADPEPAPTANGEIKSEAPPEKFSPLTSAPTSPAKRKATADVESDLSDPVDSPPPKKAKKSRDVKREEEEDDAAYAARLQAELNRLNGRSTRGGGAKPRKPVKKEKKAKRKSSAKVKEEDDSSISDDDAEKPEKEKKGGFHKPMTLSEPLSAMLGENSLSRPQTVKKIWAYVKERDLQDPSDKRQIRCDDSMRAVFKQDKVHMFTMNKLLAAHLYPQDE